MVLVAVVMLMAPVTVKVECACRKPQTQPAIQTPAPATLNAGLVFIFLWGLFAIPLRFTGAGVSRRLWPSILNTGARPNKISAGGKNKLTPGYIRHLCRLALGLHRELAPVRRYLFGRITLHGWRWHTGLGLEESHYTGLGVGALWALKSNLTAAVYRLLKSNKAAPDLAVTPFFNHDTIFWMQFHCIFSLRMGHIIYAGLLAGWLVLKNAARFGGIGDGAASHRWIDENRHGEH